jgi:hypothetical protein
MKHSIYLGIFSIDLSSFYIASGILGLINSALVTPSKFVEVLLAPLRSNALTGLVDLRSPTLLIAKWRGVKPA